MILITCLWVGALAGLVASRLIRTRRGFVPPQSSTAVGVLGALLGGLTDSWIGQTVSRLPHADILAAGAGASLALAAWAVLQRVLDERQGDSGSFKR